MSSKIEISELARKLLAEEYLEGGNEGPYPSYAELALTGNGAFTLCSLRAIQRALDLNKQSEGQTILAAPVVERQPALWVHPAYLKRDDGWTPLAIDATLNQIAPLQIPLYAAPPEVAVLQKQLGIRWKEIEAFKTVVDRQDAELAELQATIARLHEVSVVCATAEQERDQLRAEIERLKGGQGEPVAWMRKWAADGITPEKVRNENGRMAWPFKYKLVPVSQAKCLPDDVALFSSQPAPVSDDSLEAIKDRHEAWMAGVENGKASASIVLYENAEFEKWRKTQIEVLVRNGYLEGAEAFRNLGSVQWAGWQARACLDKVKELNQ